MKTTLNELRQLVRQVLKENDQRAQIEHVKSLINSDDMANVEIGCMLISSIEPPISEEKFFEQGFNLYNMNCKEFISIRQFEFQYEKPYNDLNYKTFLINKSIDLNYLNLNKIPEFFESLIHLEKLSLNHNNIVDLPEWIGQLTQLKELEISDNKLTVLPDSLGELKNLEILRISGNKLTSLPNSIGQLTQLKKLFIDYNALTSFPDSISELTQLRWLSANGNNFQTLPKPILKLKNYLRGIELSDNPISYEQQAVIRKSLPKGCEIYF